MLLLFVSPSPPLCPEDKSVTMESMSASDLFSLKTKALGSELYKLQTNQEGLLVKEKQSNGIPFK